MLEGSINNSEGHRDQYQITNMESVMNAIGLLEQTQIHVRDLQQYRIGHIVNNIRRKLGVENNDVKHRLKKLIQNWQRMAKENDQTNSANGNGQQNGARNRNEIERQEQLNERLHPTSAERPVVLENGVDPVPKKKPKKGPGRPKKIKPPKVEEVSRSPVPAAIQQQQQPPQSRTSPIAYDIANSNSPKPPTIVQSVVSRDSPIPSVESGTVTDSVKSDETEEQPEVVLPSIRQSRVVPSINLSKPINDQSSRPSSRPPSLPDFNHDDNANSSQSTTLKSRKRPHYETANHDHTVQVQRHSATDTTMAVIGESSMFSTLRRFVPSVSVLNTPQIPATPNSNEIAKAANGDEWEGVSGVRDSRGNFHRWHDEIHLEPEGTEPFLHILPYVDIDLELL